MKIEHVDTSNVIGGLDRSVPDGLTETRLGMSNFDLGIDEGFEEELKQGKFGRHASLRFNAKVWFEDGKFYSQVCVYRSPRETLCSDDLATLAAAVNDRYGWD